MTERVAELIAVKKQIIDDLEIQVFPDTPETMVEILNEQYREYKLEHDWS